MNIIIKELAEQAGFQYIKDERIGWAGNYNASLPKFAELIVRKCISEVAMMGVVHYENEDISWAVNLIIGNLKETFDIGNIEIKKTWVDLTPEEMDDIIMNAIDPVDAMIQTKDKLKENNTCEPDVNENLRNRSTYFGNDI
jgi:hypothetical protein